VSARERAAEHREVLSEHERLPPVNEPVAGDHAVAGNFFLLHPEIGAAMGDELVDLDERAGIEQQLQPFACGQLAGFVLPCDALFAARQLGALVELLQLGDGIARLFGVAHVFAFRAHGNPSLSLKYAVMRARSAGSMPRNSASRSCSMTVAVMG